MDDIAQKLAIRDSFLRKMAAKQTPDERMRDMWRMQEQELLPEADYGHNV